MDVFLNGMISCLLAFGGLLSYETLRVKLVRRNSLLYVILVVFPSLLYLTIVSTRGWGFFLAAMFPLAMLIVFRKDGIRCWIAERYERVTSDIPFFDDQNAKLRSIVLVVVIYWTIVAFFLVEGARA